MGKQFLTLTECLVHHNKYRVNKGITFINKDGDEFLSYSNLYDEALKYLYVLQQNGINKGDELVLYLNDKDNKEFIKIFWACILGDIIVVPVTTSVNENADKIYKVLKKLKNPKMLIDDEGQVSLEKALIKNHKGAEYEEIKNKVIKLNEFYGVSKKGNINVAEEDDIAFIQFSSGSTGDPKGVALTHKNLITNIYDILEGLKVTDKDKSLSWLPLTHDMGLIGFHIAPLIKGIEQIIMPATLFTIRPMLWLDKMDEYRVTVTAAPNFGLRFITRCLRRKHLAWDFSSIRKILSGSEQISVDVVHEFIDKFAEYKLDSKCLLAVYGMAEASLAIAFPDLDDGFEYIAVKRESLNIGSEIVIVEEYENDCIKLPLEGYSLGKSEIRIVDDFDEVLPEGKVGHIQIKGENVTKGYYNDIKKTEESLRKDGWFKTGDLGVIYNKQIAVIGRYKELIIVNGQNYYPQDIEKVCEDAINAKSGSCVACGFFDEKLQREKLILFIKTSKNTEEMLDLTNKIKEAVVRAYGFEMDEIIPINKIPKTTSGKIKRHDLLNKYLEGYYVNVIQEIKSLEKDEGEDIEQPANEAEEKLISIAKKILEIDKLNVTTNFLLHGINSLKIIQMAMEIESEFNINMELSDIVNNNNIRKLAERIKDKKENSKSDTFLIKQVDNRKKTENSDKPFDLSPIQLAYLLGRDERYELGGVSTHCYYELKTSMDIERLNICINKVIQKHSMLRTVFTEDFKQKELKEVPVYNIECKDMKYASKEEVDNYINKVREEMSHEVIDASTWPLFNIKAVKLENNMNYLFLGIDMLITDGASIEIMLKEIIGYYNNIDAESKELKYTFRDYLYDCNNIRLSERYRNSEEYWMNKVEEFPQAPPLPLKVDLNEIEKPKFKRVYGKIPKEVWDRTKSVVRKYGITDSALLCSFYAEILSFWSNTLRFAMTLTVFNRLQFNKEVNNIIGDFTSLILLDIDFRNKKTFHERANYVQNVIFEALENRYFEGTNVLSEIGKKTSNSNKALIPIVFTSMLSMSESNISNLKEDISVEYGVSQTPQVYLDNQVIEIDGDLIIHWDYVSQVFDESVINNMFDQYLKMIENIGLGREYEVKLSSEDLRSWEKYNDTDKKVSDDTLHGLFMKKAKEVPDNKAVILGDESIAYNELDMKSNIIADKLKDIGIKNGDYVGVIANREINTIVNMIGIAKAGAAYVPVEPSYPDDRKNYIFSNSYCKVVLDNNDITSINNDSLVDSKNIIGQGLTDTAYVIYTSGSTGKPKGVVISHKGAVNTILDINKKFNVGVNDRILGISSMCFDLSVYDIWGALTSGASLVMIKDNTNMEELLDNLYNKDITIWNSVPAIMKLAIDNLDNYRDEMNYNNCNLRLVMLSGDWIPIKLVDSIKMNFENAEVISLGGATEASIWSIYYPIKTLDSKWSSIPYGMPLSNQKIYVLNSEEKLCPVGVMGELYIGGEGLASCYMNDEEKTKYAFKIHNELGRVYRTGDYGKLHEEGYVEFLGRKDTQVKIRGFRIELAEIEKEILQNHDVKECLVQVLKDESGEDFLCAYVVSLKDIDSNDIKVSLKKKLPYYMIPNFILQLDSFPLTQNGKIDRKNLPVPEKIITSVSSTTLPTNEVEAKLVKIWNKILNVKNIGIDDNFFEFGGQSLKAIYMLTEIKKEFNIQMHVTSVFQNQTIRELAKLIDKSKLADNEQIIIQPKKEYYEVSSAEKRMFYLYERDPDSILYNNLLVLKMDGKLDIDKLKKCIQEIILRHEILRTSFYLIGEEVVQKVHDNTDLDLSVVNINDDIDNCEELINQHVNKFIRPFDLEKAPLFRTILMQFNNNKYIFALDMHHIIADGTSAILFIKEFEKLYSDEKLDEVKVQYKDFSVWQNKMLSSEKILRQEEYWMNVFKDSIPTLDFPTDFERPSKNSFNGATMWFDINNEWIDKIDKITKKYNITRFMFFLGAYNILLSKYTTQKDIVVGTVISGRSHSDLMNTMGMFINTIAIKSMVNPKMPSSEYFETLKDCCMEAFENGDYQFEMLVDKLKIKRSNRNPLFDIMLVYRNLDEESIKLPGVNVENYIFDTRISRLDMALELIESDGVISGNIQYSIDLFKEETINTLVEHYKKIIECLIENFDVEIGNIELISPKKDVVFEYNEEEFAFDSI